MFWCQIIVISSKDSIAMQSPQNAIFLLLPSENKKTFGSFRNHTQYNLKGSLGSRDKKKMYNATKKKVLRSLLCCIFLDNDFTNIHLQQSKKIVKKIFPFITFQFLAKRKQDNKMVQMIQKCGATNTTSKCLLNKFNF